jgi:hypothetical protein
MGSILWLLWRRLTGSAVKLPTLFLAGSSLSWSDLADPISSLKDAPRSAWACSWRLLLRSLSRGPLRRCLRPLGLEARVGGRQRRGV